MICISLAASAKSFSGTWREGGLPGRIQRKVGWIISEGPHYPRHTLGQVVMDELFSHEETTKSFQGRGDHPIRIPKLGNPGIGLIVSGNLHAFAGSEVLSRNPPELDQSRQRGAVARDAERDGPSRAAEASPCSAHF